LQALAVHAIEQHCTSVVHCVPLTRQQMSLTHCAGPQQSLVCVQGSVSTAHPIAPHIPLTHVIAQHWSSDWQLSPGVIQAPSPQTSLVQLAEQHWDALMHSWPLGVQAEPTTQVPPEHAPEQHWPSPLQGMPSAVQLPGPQTPFVQS
jgi:hypothetical protein